MHTGYNAGTITEEEMETYEAMSEIPARLKARLDTVVRHEMTEHDLREMLAGQGGMLKKMGQWGARPHRALH
jgi:hypothetical protein